MSENPNVNGNPVNQPTVAPPALLNLRTLAIIILSALLGVGGNQGINMTCNPMTCPCCKPAPHDGDGENPPAEKDCDKCDKCCPKCSQCPKCTPPAAGQPAPPALCTCCVECRCVPCRCKANKTQCAAACKCCP